MRWLAVAVWLVVAVVLYWLGLLFGLNSSQWDWWEGGCIACAGLAFVLAGTSARPPRRVLRPPAAAGAAGLVAVGASTALMALRYSEPYAGPLLWPHVLACVAAVGLAVVLVYAWAATLPR